MEDAEIPLEQVQENAHHASGERGLLSWAALSSAIIAACAAIAALVAGQHANEAMFDQISSANEWNYYQAKGVKAAVLASKIELLTDLNKPVSESDRKKIASYHTDQEQIAEKAHEHEAGAKRHLEIHELIARSVTLFQVAIALAAVSILSKKRKFLFVSYALTLIGLLFFAQGLLR